MSRGRTPRRMWRGFLGRPVSRIGCRASRSGSMRRVRVRRRGIPGGRTSVATGRTAAVAGVVGTALGRRRRVRSRRTAGVCTTCTGTCGNGWRIAGTRTTRGRRATARRGRAVRTVVAVCCGAVPGSTLGCSCVRRLASTLAAGARYLQRRFSCFEDARLVLESLPLYLLGGLGGGAPQRSG